MAVPKRRKSRSERDKRRANHDKVVAPNVVLVKFVDGKQARWKALPEVWQHVGDKAAFLDFVQNRLREFLQEPGAKSPGSAPVPTQAPERTDPLSLPIPE